MAVVLALEPTTIILATVIFVAGIWIGRQF